MDDDLFFPRSKLSDDPINRGYRWSLRLVKVAQEKSAHLAFRTRNFVDSFVHADGVSVVASSELDDSHYYDFERAHRIV